MSDLGNKEVMARNIRKYLELFNVSRKDICKDLDIKYTTFADWLNAKTYPRIDKIEKMANYFKIPKSSLVEDDHLSDRVQAYASLLNQLPKKKQDIIFSLIDELSEE